jgi:hypothetical protein
MPLFIIGLIFFLAGFIPLIMALNMYFWPSVPGEVIFTQIKKIERDDDGEMYYDHCPIITYSYTGTGTNYENDVYSTDTLLGNYNSFYCDDDMETTMEFLKVYPAQFIFKLSL